MWTPAARAELVREALPYAACLSDAERVVLAPLLPAPARTGRPWLWSQRTALDGILYVLRVGCAWRHLPLDFPPWGTVHRWFLRWAQAGVFERLAHALTLADRQRVGREAGPTGAILDAQAARSGGVGVEGVRGYDPAKRVVGRKRHALTDIDGRLLMAAVSPADLHDSHGSVALLQALRQLWPFLAHCFADRAYRGERVGTACFPRGATRTPFRRRWSPRISETWRRVKTILPSITPPSAKQVAASIEHIEPATAGWAGVASVSRRPARTRTGARAATS